MIKDERFDGEVVDSSVVFHGRVWDVRSDVVRYGDGEIVRDYVDHTGAAAVVAVDDERRVLLIQQYRHPTRSPLPYWREALRRDPGHSRTNLAMAERALRSGDYATALEHARTAVARVTVRNENPQDAESYYLLGLVLERTGRLDEAVRCYAKATWDRTWAVPAGVLAARIALRRRDAAAAEADARALAASGAEDPRLDAIRVVALRRLGRDGEAVAVLAEAMKASPLDDLLRYLADGSVPGDAGLEVDLALDLHELGEDAQALAVLAKASTRPPTPASPSARNAPRRSSMPAGSR